MRSVKILRFGLSLAALLGASKAGAQVSLSPSGGTLVPGTTASVQVSVQVGTIPLGGYLYGLSFDSRILTLQSVTALGPLTEIFSSSGIVGGSGPFLGLNPASLSEPMGRVALATLLFEVTRDTAIFSSGSVVVATVTVTPVDMLNTAAQSLAVAGAEAAFQVLGDTIPPVTQIVFTPPSTESDPEGKPILTTSTLVSFDPRDPDFGGFVSGADFTEFLVDQDSATAVFQRFTAPFTLSEGPHTLFWASRDRAANQEAVRSTSVFVGVPDVTPPETTLVVIGPQFINSTGTLFTATSTFFGFLAVDPATGPFKPSGVDFTEFRIDSDTAPFQTFVSSFPLVEGIRRIDFRSQDKAGNLEAFKSSTVFVDGTAPLTQTALTGISFVSPETGRVFVSTLTEVGFDARDPVVREVASGVDFTEFRVDAATSAPFSRSTSTFSLAEGERVIDFRSQDNVQNLEVTRSTSVLADGTAPESRLSIGAPQALLPDGSVLVGPFTPLLVISTDPVSNGVASGVKDSFVAVDTAAFQVAQGTFTLSPPSGPRTVRFFSRDNVLNEEVAKSATVVLDATPPEARLLSPSQDGQGMDQVFGKGVIPVFATVSDAHLKSFLLEFAPTADATTGFALLAQGTTRVSQAQIARWDAASLSGFFTLRLTATDLVDNTAVSTAAVFIGDPVLLLALENTDKGRRLLDKPEGAAVDSLRDIYVANTGKDEVLKFSPEGRLLATFDGLTTLLPSKPDDGKGKEKDDDKLKTLRFDKPTGLAVDSEFNLYVADRNNNRIAILNLMGTVSRSVGRTNPEGKFIAGKGPGEFNKPTGVAVSKDRIAVVDRNNERVQVFDPNFNFLFEIKPAEAVPAAREPENDDDEEDGEKEEESKPFGVALDRENNIYVTDEENGRILAFDPQGKLLFALGREGKLLGGGAQPLGQFENPKGISASPLKYLYAADRGNKRVQKIDPFQNAVLAFGPAFGLHHPVGMALDGRTELYVTDRKEDRVLKFGLPDGTLVVALPPRGKTKKMRVNSTGGKVEREDGVKVEIPEGALKAEMEVTIEPERDAAPEEKKRKEEMRELLGLRPVSDGVEYGPQGTKFDKPVTLTLAYDPKSLPPGTKEEDLLIYHWNPQRPYWEALKSVVDRDNKTVSAQTTHFSLYQVMAVQTESAALGTASLGALVADPTFRLVEVYAFPNPAKKRNPTIRAQVGLANLVQINIYDIAGESVHGVTLTSPAILDDGNGKGPQYTYDYVWDTGGVGSGVYIYVVTAKKAGHADIKVIKKVAVLK